MTSEETHMTDAPVTDHIPVTRRRIPKACNSCRQSKVKCDVKRPCTRCSNLKKTCIFVEQAKESNEEKLETLEKEVQHLRQLLDAQRANPAAFSRVFEDGQMTLQGQRNGSEAVLQQSLFVPGYEVLQSPHSTGALTSSDFGTAPNDFAQTSRQRLENWTHAQTIDSHSAGTENRLSRKRKRQQFEVQHSFIPDFVTTGLVSLEQAQTYFNTFFTGCDRYVPVFDPQHDTFQSIRSRSGLLFNAICTIGCAVQNETGSQTSQFLSFELKKWLNVIIMSRKEHCLETVQALLVTACYSSDRSLILSFATRMALDLELPEAYEELTRRLVINETREWSGTADTKVEELSLMRQIRTWFGLLVLEHILRVDAGKFPGFTLKSGVRRCRILLHHGISTTLDLRLFSQVELNFIRAKIHDSLSGFNNDDDADITDLIRDAKIDLDVWFRDWFGTIESSPIPTPETPSLVLNLKVQKYWAETMSLCKAVRSMGVENIAAMAPDVRTILHMAKESLKKHLEAIISEPQHYLFGFKFAMDFVWAKCAFSFLLLLKLNRLLPETEEENYQLLAQGTQLLSELNKVGASGGSSASRLYLQVLNLSIEKYGRALQEHQHSPGSGVGGPSTGPGFFWQTQNAQAELESFVPEQFVFEWDFPGLTLFSSPTAWEGFFDELLLGNGNINDVMHQGPGPSG